MRGIISNFLSQYSWCLDRKIDIGNNKVNYVRKFLVTRNIDNQKDPPHPPCGRGDSVYFHATKKKKTKNKQTSYKGYYRPLQVCAGKAFDEKALKCLSTTNDVKLVATALQKMLNQRTLYPFEANNLWTFPVLIYFCPNILTKRKLFEMFSRCGSVLPNFHKLAMALKI